MKVHIVHFASYRRHDFSDGPFYAREDAAIKAVCSTRGAALGVMKRKLTNLRHRGKVSINAVANQGPSESIIPINGGYVGYFVSSHTVDATGAYTPAGYAAHFGRSR